MSSEEELIPLKPTVRMHVPGEGFNRTVDIYRVSTPQTGTNAVTGKVKVSYRIAVKSDRNYTVDRATREKAEGLRREVIDNLLDNGGRAAKPGLPDGSLVQTGL